MQFGCGDMVGVKFYALCYSLELFLMKRVCSCLCVFLLVQKRLRKDVLVLFECL